MTPDFLPSTIHIGDALITMSSALAYKLTTWSDMPARAYNLSPTECAGFVNAPAHNHGVSMVIDVLVRSSSKEATLRLWAIEIVKDADKNRVFNNIQLEFSLGYKKAQPVAAMAGNITREDIRSLLHDEGTTLTKATVSYQAGRHKQSKKILGERIDLSGEALASADSNTLEKTAKLLKTALKALERSATVETTKQ